MIDLQDIHVRYTGRRGVAHAVRGVNLHVGRGEVFGVIGRSGAGKSTLVRVVNLLTRPSEGRVHVAGRELTALAPAQLREARHHIGMVFQHFNLLSSRTVRANVALPLELAGVPRADIERRVADLLSLVGLGDLGERYPSQISGGQKQRVGIARALASRPQVLLCDEPTSALDPETTRAILGLLRTVQREFGLTIVLITHQMQVIKQVADRVAVMDHGQVVEQGAVVDVFTRPQHDTTRSLIEEIVPQALPAGVLERIRSLMSADPDGRVLRLAFAGDGSDRPLLSELVRRFGLDLNIVHGQVDEIQGRPFGSLAVHARGTRDQLAAAVSHLRGAGVVVQEVAHV